MTTTTFRLTGRARKAVLVSHIVAAAMWFGVDLALGILAITALLTSDPQTAGIALQAIQLFAVWPMFGAAIVSLGTGVLLGLGSKYGLLRYKWVAVKLAINLLMAALLLVALRPGVNEGAAIGERLIAGDPTAEVPAGMLFPVFVAPTLLVIAFVLATFKPWGRLRKDRPSTTATRELVGAQR
jgi:hypothetical protein